MNYTDDIYINELRTNRNLFGKIFSFSVTVVLGIYVLVYTFSNQLFHKPPPVPLELLIVSFCAVVYITYLLSKGNFDFYSVYKIVLFSFLAYFTYISLLLCLIDGTIFIMFMPVIALTLILFSFRYTVLLAMLIIVFCFFLQDISKYFKIGIQPNFYNDNAQLLAFHKYAIILISTYFTLLFIYFYVRFEKLEFRASLLKNEIKTVETSHVENEEYFSKNIEIAIPIDEENKHHNLYKRIIEAFEKDKVYRDPELTIQKLADNLNSNTSYISKSLNQIGNKKFTQFLNEYRMSEVLSDFSDNIHKKFTIEHIYSKAGFSQQSTFNRIFKEYTGKTPSDYIEDLEK